MAFKQKVLGFCHDHPGFARFIAFCCLHFPFGNILKLRGTALRYENALILKSRFFSRGKGNEITIGKSTRLQNCTIRIFGSKNHIVIGDSCRLCNAEFWIEDDGGEIVIGDRTTICGKTHFASIEGCRISVGENCLFSAEITVRTGDSHSILDADGKRINPSQAVEIGDRVWIGHGATLLKGSSVASDSIIGTRSVVTKKFTEPHVAIAGVPAKVVKSGVSWLGERI